MKLELKIQPSIRPDLSLLTHDEDTSMTHRDRKILACMPTQINLTTELEQQLNKFEKYFSSKQNDEKNSPQPSKIKSITIFIKIVFVSILLRSELTI